MDVVYVTAWMTTILFLAARLKGPPPAFLRWSDLCGIVVLWSHIVLAYWLTHAGSHAAAVEHVAEQTDSMIGLRTGVGIYANFGVAILWPLQVFEFIPEGTGRRISELALWFMFFCASVVFAQPTTAVIFTILFVLVAISRKITVSENPN